MKIAIALVAVACALGSAGTARAADLDLEAVTVPQLQQQLQSGELTSVQLTRAYINRIAALNHRGPGLNAVRILNPSALTDAALSDYARRHGQNRGPMMGVPVLLKDNIDVAGLPTTAGAVALESSIPKTDSPLVAALRKAGAIILGKTNLSEFANFITNTNPSGYSGLGGQVITPIDADLNPSGSSSGSAAAAAAALSAVTVGTETSGSIVSPSSTQGVVGLRPTVGLVSRTGILPIAASQDTAGPIVRNVADAAALLQAMVSKDAEDPYTSTQPATIPDYLAGLKTDALNGARIGIINNSDPNYQAAITAVRALGATTVTVSTPGGTNAAQVLDYEFKRDLDNYLARLGAGAPMKSLADIIAFNLASDRNTREGIKFGQTELTTAQAIDISPGSAATASYATALAQGKSQTQGNLNAAYTRATTDPSDDLDALLTPSGTLTGTGARAGFPQLVVPAGYSTTTRRPVNIAFNGPAYSEAKLLAYGYAYEQATKLRKPASVIDPSVFRCAKTTPPSPFASRGSCAPDVSVLDGLGAVPSIPDLETATAQDLRARIAAGTLTSVGLTKAYLARIARANTEGPSINAVRALNPNALAEAAAADARHGSGPLEGLPVLVSDALDVKGMPTTGGSVALDSNVATADSDVVAKLRAAGAVILGKTNVTEFNGFTSTNMPSGYSSLGGQVLDPYDTDVNPGGPSAGAASAAGAGLAALTVGTEGAGSLIAPSATQSVVALHPTVGSISRAGLLPVGLTTETAGPIGRGVYDVAAGFQALAGGDVLSGLSAGALAGKTIGVTNSTDLNYQAAVAVLQAAGATTRLITAPTASTTSIVAYEFKRDAGAYLGAHGRSLADVIAYNDAHPDEALKYGEGQLTAAQALDTSAGSADTTAYQTAAAAGTTATRAALDTALTGLDAIMTPATTITTLASRAGYPQLTVPAGYNTLNPNSYTTNPVGVTFTGRSGGDGALLALGYAYEQASKLRKPASYTNPGTWRCLPDAAFPAHSCAPGDLANPVPNADVIAGDVGGSVPATLALTLGAPAAFGAFTPGVANAYTASMTATAISSAGDGLLSVGDPSATATGHLVNGAFALPQALQVSATSPLAASTAGVSPVGAQTPLLSYSGPVANDVATVAFVQAIGATDALRTGSYSKTLTFTLSTTQP